jgi:hypothetical protein
MKYALIRVLCILIPFVSLISCEDGVTPGEHTIKSAEYTGQNTARVIYKSTDWNMPLYGDVRIFNANFSKEYLIVHETHADALGRNRYAVDITVTPDWLPGDLVTVEGNGYFIGSAYFEVPQ